MQKTFWLFAEQDPDPQSSGTDPDQNATDPEHCFKAVLRVRAVYPGSRILIFTHPGSRIQKRQQKRGVKKKNSCHTFLCSHKFHKI
jgi:hypothetical protein